MIKKSGYHAVNMAKLPVHSISHLLTNQSILRNLAGVGEITLFHFVDRVKKGKTSNVLRAHFVSAQIKEIITFGSAEVNSTEMCFCCSFRVMKQMCEGVTKESIKIQRK